MLRPSRWLLVSVFGSLLLAAGCGSESANNPGGASCSDGIDNDGDGAIDFPDDSGCANSNDDEDDLIPPQCADGRDNDGDGKTDAPNDPGCFAPNQDSEEDDCPDGPNCPECSDGKDNDDNGQTDFPNDSGGCMSAADDDEYTQNPVACGAAVRIEKMPYDGHITGMLDAAMPSSLNSMTCGGGGSERAYELRITEPKVVVATSDMSGTTADTVLYIRSADCSNPANELACNDDISTTNDKSSITKAISTPGTYYLVVDAHDSASAGPFDIQVTFFAGEGQGCAGATDCGPGLVCRVPKGQTAKVCAKHVCDDDVDEDDDGKNGYPNDPGCTSATDDDEGDSCPGVGPNCPECSDGVDNDGDMKTDYGMSGDTTCSSASSASEACVSTDGVEQLTQPSTPGTTVGAHSDVAACTVATSSAPDKTYRIDIPAMTTLTIDAYNDDTLDWDGVLSMFNSTCAGTALACEDVPETIEVTNQAAGTYYVVLKGYYTAESGPFTLNVRGTIKNGESCESALAQSGAITCGTGYICKGTVGARKCQQAQCSDGINNNDGDSKIDFPFDPGCSSISDDDETDPTTAPVCSDGTDNDGDNLTDFAQDWGCAGAAGTSEKFCPMETDIAATALITAKETLGTTAMMANDFNPGTPCLYSNTSSNAPDITLGLQLPVPVATLVIDTIGSGFDTVLSVRSVQCDQQLACDDEGGASSNSSKITMSNVWPGNYAVTIDGYSTKSGAYKLHVTGTVAAGTSCTSPLFSGGANAVLVCPTGTTCTGTPAKCQ
jgi:hypothetical protein